MFTVAFVLGLGLALASVACGRSDPRPESQDTPAGPKRGGNLSIILREDHSDWDPSYLGKSGGAQGLVLAYDNLVGFRSGADVPHADNPLAPELAERWTVSPDAKTFTFHLRKGVKFQDVPPVHGRQLGAGDVKFSYEYWSRTGEFKEKKLPQGQWDWMFEGLDRIETPDPYTAVVHFKSPFVPFAGYAAAERGTPIVPREIYDQDGHVRERIVGTGPYQLDDKGSQPGSRWVWKRNPSYWETGKPYVDEVRELVLKDDATAFAAFRTKQLDVLGDVTGWTISSEASQSIRRDNPNALMLEFLQPKPLLLYMNQEKPPFSDVRIRKAVSLALDRDEFSKVLAAGKGGWALNGALAGLFAQEEIRGVLRHDLAEARRLVVEAGYPSGVDVEFIYPNTWGDRLIAEMQLFQAQLKKVGINLVFKSVGNDDHSARKKDRNYIITTTPGSAMDGDVDSWIFSDFFPGSKKDYQGINDPGLGELLNAQRAEPDPAKRREVLRQTARYINVEKVYGLSIYHGVDYVFWQPYVKDYHPNFWGKRWNVVNRWLDK